MLTIAKNLYDYRELMFTLAWKNISLRYKRHANKLLSSMDVVHVNHPFLSGSLALRYCRPRGIPIIFTNHTRYDLYAQAYLPVMPDVVGNAALVLRPDGTAGILSFRAEARNIFNRLYFQSGEGDAFFPAAERNYLLGVTAEF